MSGQRNTLDHLPEGSTAQVTNIDTDEVDAARIKRMGICEGRRIQLVKSGDPMIVRVVGTRVGISAQLAPSIEVEMCEQAANAVSPDHSTPVAATEKAL